MSKHTVVEPTSSEEENEETGSGNSQPTSEEISDYESIVNSEDDDDLYVSPNEEDKRRKGEAKQYHISGRQKRVLVSSKKTLVQLQLQEIRELRLRLEPKTPLPLLDCYQYLGQQADQIVQEV